MDLCIPNDIVIDILLRLPADSLVRLRWACKYWFDLVTRDPSFIKMHFHHSTYNENINNNPCVLLSDWDRNLFKRYFNYITYNASSKVVKLDFPFKHLTFKYPSDGFTLLSSCNGLIFFKSSSTLGLKLLCIWNPCTKEYRALPEPLVKSNDEIVSYGFGYDQTIDDYKVIRNSYCYRSKDGNETNIVQVYTLRANSWTSIRTIPNNIGRLKDVGVFLNGALYWIIDWRVISFDINKEKYQQVSTEPAAGMHSFRQKLKVFEGSLCLITKSTFDDEFMYIMNKETYSWTVVRRNLAPPVIKPLRLTKTGNILIVGNRPSDLILLLRRKELFASFNICHDEDVELRYVVEVYIESLVSLNSNTYVGGRMS